MYHLPQHQYLLPDGLFATTDDHTLTRHYHPKPMADIRGHPWHCTSLGLHEWVMACIHHCNVTQQSHCPENSLCSPVPPSPVPPKPGKQWFLHCPRTCASSRRSVARILQRAAPFRPDSHWTPSIQNSATSSHGLRAHFYLALNTIPSLTWTTFLTCLNIDYLSVLVSYLKLPKIFFMVSRSTRMLPNSWTASLAG